MLARQMILISRFAFGNVVLMLHAVRGFGSVQLHREAYTIYQLPSGHSKLHFGPNEVQEDAVFVFSNLMSRMLRPKDTIETSAILETLFWISSLTRPLESQPKVLCGESEICSTVAPSS